MKIEVTKKEFVKALAIGGSLAGNSKILPILDCVKIKAKNGSVTIVSSDNENAISKRLEEGVTTDGEFMFCVDMKDMMSYIKQIPTESIVITLDNGNVYVEHEKGSMSLPMVNADEFPVLKSEDSIVEVNIPVRYLAKWIKEGMRFVATDDLRPVMNGVYVYKKDGEIGCCASDGHSLYTDSYVTDEQIEDFSFILNKTSFRGVLEAVSSSESVTVKAGSQNVKFVVDGCSVIARLTEGKYPNFRSVIPKESENTVTINKDELLEAIARASVGANRNTMLTKLSFNGSDLEVSCEDIDFNKKTKETIHVDGNDVVMTIGFNSSILTKILNVVSTEKADIIMRNSSCAVLVKESDTESRKLFMIMPMMID